MLIHRYKRWLQISFALIMLTACWEMDQGQAVAANKVIPEEAIRLRILANSDSVEDQWLKHHIREVIVAQINQWPENPDRIEEARALIESRMPELYGVVEQFMRQHPQAYSFRMELGMADFPTKKYGDRVYPAGEYEALRIVLGEGRGQNWWCVLFPPLCFVDMFTGVATATAQDSEELDSGELAYNEQIQLPEVRFFFWDALQNFSKKIRSFFV